MRTMWSSDMDAHFPPGFADANMIVIQVDVDRIEVHVRGLTPEPFGAGRTLLERQSDGTWRFIPAWVLHQYRRCTSLCCDAGYGFLCPVICNDGTVRGPDDTIGELRQPL